MSTWGSSSGRRVEREANSQADQLPDSYPGPRREVGWEEVVPGAGAVQEELGGGTCGTGDAG